MTEPLGTAAKGGDAESSATQRTCHSTLCGRVLTSDRLLSCATTCTRIFSPQTRRPYARQVELRSRNASELSTNSRARITCAYTTVDERRTLAHLTCSARIVTRSATCIFGWTILSRNLFTTKLAHRDDSASGWTSFFTALYALRWFRASKPSHPSASICTVYLPTPFDTQNSEYRTTTTITQPSTHAELETYAESTKPGWSTG
ncbi:hypothetical protein PENSPDRAFT_339286 [Peniophora sp. CONT]|nr:hypothetical protein PENSPDRAFT_339286 [Peniophora sp. CONT]